jgi:hypothetical protein
VAVAECGDIEGVLTIDESMESLEVDYSGVRCGGTRTRAFSSTDVNLGCVDFGIVWSSTYCATATASRISWWNMSVPLIPVGLKYYCSWMDPWSVVDFEDAQPKRKLIIQTRRTCPNTGRNLAKAWSIFVSLPSKSLPPVGL